VCDLLCVNLINNILSLNAFCLFDHQIVLQFIIVRFMQYIVLHQSWFPNLESYFCNMTCKRCCVKGFSGLEIKSNNSIYLNKH